MDLEKVNVKFFVANSEGIPLTAFIDLFHSWVQASDGDYYDVADYSHMQGGPGILLVSHEANISMDNTGDRLGLLYSRKQLLGGSIQERLQFVFKTVLEFCLRVENDPALGGRIKFRGDECLFLMNDRLLAPNTKETFCTVKPELEALAGTLYGGSEFTLDHNHDPKQRFSVSIKASRVFEVDTLLKNLGSPRARLVEVSAT